MVDLNQWWRIPGDQSRRLDLAAVRRIADELHEHDVLWIEEPLPAADLAGMRSLREQTGIRVAGGEMARTARRAAERDQGRGARRRCSRI